MLVKFITKIFHFNLIFFVCISVVQVRAQSIPLAQGVQNRFNENVLESGSDIFTGFRAMDALELKDINFNKNDIQDSLFSLSYSVNPFRERLLQGNWLQWKTKGSIIALDPYIDATVGFTNHSGGGMLINGLGGATLRSVFYNQLTFQATVFGGQSEFPDYVENYIRQHNNEVPGEKNAKMTNNGSWSYFHLNASLNWIPDNHVAVSAGYGKLFIGDGYRSLLLSDNAADYPYLRLKASYWKLTYNVIYSRFENERVVDGIRQPKYSVIHYLGANIGKRFQFGFFENTLWLGRDTNFQRGFDVQYVNPLVLMRPVEFSLGSTDNAMMGFTGKYTFKSGYIYGQFGLDDINLGETFKNKEQHINNKYFFQIGLWKHNLFKLNNLDWRIEWNGVRPYTFGHRKPDQNYTHNYQPLADPFQANFHEFISIFYYHNRRWFGSLENLLTLRGENPGLSYNNGEDLWGGEYGVPKLGSKTLQGDVYHYWFNRLNVGFLLNPKNRLSLQADVFYRLRSGSSVQQEAAFGFLLGIKTDLFNHYHDF